MSQLQASFGGPADDGGEAMTGGDVDRRFHIIAEVSAGATWLAEDAAGHRRILKSLDEECLWRRQLHPMIKDRLGRVRELATVNIATLYGVERAGDSSTVWLVWEYLPGMTLDEWAAEGSRSADDVRAILREAALLVAALHGRGIIHGAIHGRNIIVSPAGQVRLTHASPLLYDDEAVDRAAFFAMARAMINAGGDGAASLTAVVNRAESDAAPMRDIARQLSNRQIDAIVRPAPGANTPAEARVRLRAWLAAIATLALGAIASYAARHLLGV